MSPNEQVNPVRDAGFQQQKLQNNLTELLQKTVKDFSEWSTKKQMLAVGAAGAIFFTALPVLAVALPFVATGAVVGLALFFTVNAALYAFKALVWSGKKAKDGLGYVTDKAVKGAVYSKDKVVDGFGSLKGGISAVGSTMREGTSSTLKTVGRRLSGLGESMGDSDSIPFTIAHNDTGVAVIEGEKVKKFSSVREMFFEEIFQDKISNKSALVKKVFSKIGSKIAEKAYLVPNQGVSNSKLINQLEKQADFISKLDAKKLKNLLAENNHDPQLYKIFSEYHDEIKSIIKECKEEQTRLNAAAEQRSRSKSAPAQPTSSLPESSSLNSVSTDGSEERQKVKSKFWSLSRLGRSAKETKEKTQEQPSSDLEADFTRFATTRANRNPSQARGPIPVTPPKSPRSSFAQNSSNDSALMAEIDRNLKAFGASSNSALLDGEISTVRSESPSTDSGFNSPTSSPSKRSYVVDINNPSIDNLKVAKEGLRETGTLPKSQMSIPEVHHTAYKAPGDL